MTPGGWYVVAESHALKPGRVLAAEVAGERIAVFRGPDGAPAALRDRCAHRAGMLTRGAVEDGCLRCPYHGWRYRPDGVVDEVPAEPDAPVLAGRRGHAFPAAEADGYVYAQLGEAPARPPAMPHWGERGWGHVRVVNRFQAGLVACVENFIDVPHTVFVHPGIFRARRSQPVELSITRSGGVVHVDYRGETDNLGWLARLLNPTGAPIRHTDTFSPPNRTHVRYELPRGWFFLITSQSVPVGPHETMVYTDLTYRFGWLTPFAGPVVRWLGQRVIDQDLVVLAEQTEVLKRYPGPFANTRADLVHVLVESVVEELEAGRDPALLPDKAHEVRVHV